MEKKDVTILVTDDEKDIQELIQFQLENEGYKVLTASSGEEAYKTLTENEIHVIVTDIRMPNGDGIELLEKISVNKKLNPPCFYFMTGFADITKEQSIEKGARGFFSKPFDLKEFTAEINNCVENNILK
jgi:CheY-like chemotaxis protein